MTLEQLLQELSQLAEDLRVIKCSKNVRLKLADITDKDIEVWRYYINYYRDELQQMVDVSQQEILDILGEIVPEAELVNARKSSVYGNFNTLSDRLAPSEQEIKDSRSSSTFGVNYATMDARTEAHEQKTKNNTTAITGLQGDVLFDGEFSVLTASELTLPISSNLNDYKSFEICLEIQKNSGSWYIAPVTKVEKSVLFVHTDNKAYAPVFVNVIENTSTQYIVSAGIVFIKNGSLLEKINILNQKNAVKVRKVIGYK